ncbi:hypothetical protein GCM10012320_10160 [Sinomonas cellulolyticus]|nr:hypothetical protein GCM10012320_10160 [Sinomonas sp. KCTC 49339]
MYGAPEALRIRALDGKRCALQSVTGLRRRRDHGFMAQAMSPQVIPAHVPGSKGTGRWAAAAATAGGAAHLAMVPGGGWMAVLALAMAAACAPCAWHLWRRPSTRAARALIAMSLAMVAVHSALVLGAFGGNTGAGSHAHGMHGSARAGAVEAMVWGHGTMLAVIAVELVTALSAAAWVGRQRKVRAGVVRA